MKKIFTLIFIFGIIYSQAVAQNSDVVWWQKASQVETGGIAYSPDGNFLFANIHNTSAGQQSAQLEKWDMKSGTLAAAFDIKQVYPLMTRSSSWILATGGYKSMFFGDTDPEIDVYDAQTGALLRSDIPSTKSNPYRVWAISVLPDGENYAVFTAQSIFIEVINLNDPAIRRQIPLNNGANVLYAGFSHNGAYAVVTFADSTASVFKTDNGTLLKTVKLPSRADGADVSPDGQFLVTGLQGADTPIKLFIIQTSQLANQWSSDFTAYNFPRFTPNGKMIIWAGINTHAQGVSLADNGRFTIDGSLSGYDMKFSPSSPHIAGFSSDASLQIRDIDHRILQYKLRTVQNAGHIGPVYGVAFSKNGSEVYSAGSDGLLKIWDTGTGDLLQTIPAHSSEIRGFGVSPTGDTIATGSSRPENSVKIWNAATKEFLKTVGTVKDFVMDIEYSPEGNFIAAATYSGGTYIWNIKTGEEQILDTARTWLKKIAFSPDGNWLAIGGFDRLVTLYEKVKNSFIYKSEFLADTKTNNNWGITSLEFSADSRQLFTATEDNSLRIWDIPEGIQKFKMTLPVKGGDFANAATDMKLIEDGKTLLISGSRGPVFFLDIETKSIFKTIDTLTMLPYTYGRHINDMAVSPDEEFTAVVNDSGDVIVFKTGVTTSIEEDTEPYLSEIKIMPHPVLNIAHITFPEEITGEISIFDRLGNPIETEITYNGNSATFKTDKIASGLYTVKCKTKSGIVFKNFIISH